MHVAFDQALAGKSDARFALFLQFVAFRNCAAIWFPHQEFNPAGRAARIASATMQNVNTAVLDGFDQSFAFRRLKLAVSFDLQLGHVSLLDVIIYGHFNLTKDRRTGRNVAQAGSK
jgi:hypothetical protein